MKIPTSKIALNDLSPLIPLVYQAAEVGTQQGRDYFGDGKAFEPHLYAQLVRYHANEFLKAQGHHTEFDKKDLANSGIYLIAGRYHIRFLKTKEGKIPAPGHSKARQRFWSHGYQTVFEFMKDNSEDDGTSPIHLLILWDANSHHNLKGLTLVCPKGGGILHAESFWIKGILHPAEMSTGNEDQVPPTADVYDLDISVLDDNDDLLWAYQ